MSSTTQSQISGILRDDPSWRVVDDFSRECLATVVDTSLGGMRVVRELEQLALEHNTLKVIVSDNDTKLTNVAAQGHRSVA